jgi:hypothetical protein
VTCRPAGPSCAPNSRLKSRQRHRPLGRTSKAAGLVRLEAVDGSSKRWVEPEQVEELVNSGNYRRV